jgi:hypothetical protein
MLPVAMEYDAALSADDLISASLKKVEQSDAYVLRTDTDLWGAEPTETLINGVGIPPRHGIEEAHLHVLDEPHALGACGRFPG